MKKLFAIVFLFFFPATVFCMMNEECENELTPLALQVSHWATLHDELCGKFDANEKGYLFFVRTYLEGILPNFTEDLDFKNYKLNSGKDKTGPEIDFLRHSIYCCQEALRQAREFFEQETQEHQRKQSILSGKAERAKKEAALSKSLYMKKLEDIRKKKESKEKQIKDIVKVLVLKRNMGW